MRGINFGAFSDKCSPDSSVRRALAFCAKGRGFESHWHKKISRHRNFWNAVMCCVIEISWLSMFLFKKNWSTSHENFSQILNEDNHDAKMLIIVNWEKNLELSELVLTRGIPDLDQFSHHQCGARKWKIAFGLASGNGKRPHYNEAKLPSEAWHVRHQENNQEQGAAKEGAFCHWWQRTAASCYPRSILWSTSCKGSQSCINFCHSQTLLITTPITCNFFRN